MAPLHGPCYDIKFTELHSRLTKQEFDKKKIMFSHITKKIICKIFCRRNVKMKESKNKVQNLIPNRQFSGLCAAS